MKVASCLVFALVCWVSNADIESDYQKNALLTEEITQFASVSDVTYYIYNQNGIDYNVVTNGNVQQLATSSKFDPSKYTYFIIHGWLDNYSANVNTLIKAALFGHFDVNVIVVDWSPIANQGYLTARYAVADIGQFVGTFINSIFNTFGITGDQITIIGHSLGAHISGNAGKILQSPAGEIIGLDAAGLLFSQFDTDRLGPTDAKYVKVIHTNGRLLGYATSIGTVDYYPNGGQVQPGCGLDLSGSCSHERSILLLAEGIRTGGFTSTLCSSYTNYESNRCTNNTRSQLGSIVPDQSIVGNYYLTTNEVPPYSQG